MKEDSRLRLVLEKIKSKIIDFFKVVNYKYFILAMVMVGVVLWYVFYTYRAYSLSEDLNEYVKKENPLDDYGMTAKMRVSGDKVMVDIKSIEPTGTIYYDDGTIETTYDITGFEGISSGHRLESSARNYLVSSYLKSRTSKEQAKLQKSLDKNKVGFSPKVEPADVMISKYDSIKVAFIRVYLTFCMEVSFNARSFRRILDDSKVEFRIERLNCAEDKPIWEFLYINPSLGEGNSTGLSDESYEYLRGKIKEVIEEKKKEDPNHVRNVIVSYFREKILSSINDIENYEEMLMQSGCDSVVVTIQKDKYDGDKAKKLSFNLRDGFSNADDGKLYESAKSITDAIREMNKTSK